MHFLFLDPTYFLYAVPGLLLALWASWRVKATFAKYSKVATAGDVSGAWAARAILNAHNLSDVPVEEVAGRLSDHYDPSKKVLRLSPRVHDGRSVASVGIAAHEVGHALQHAVSYAPLKLRTGLVPMAGFGSYLAWPMIIIGMLLNSMNLVYAGIILFTVLVVFQIVTLPVEFNASSRAKKLLPSTGIVVDERELSGVSSVLNAAALTYVAATVTAIAQLLYFLLRAGLLSGGRD